MSEESSIDPALIQAYRETDYIIDDDPPVLLRIGEQNDGLRVMLASFGVETGAFITAWNPDGEAQAADRNYERQADLLDEIEKLRLNYFVGKGQHPEQAWYEDSFFILGITRDQAWALAEQFDQNGFVWADMSGVPELVLLK